jgi:protein required for attachment to host cells
MKPVRTLVVLANDREARFLENDGVGKGLHQTRHLDREGLVSADIAYAAQPGRSQAAPGGARHGMEPSTPEDDQNRARFAAALAAEVDKALRKGGYDRLIVSAPAKMLGALRAKLPHDAQAKIAADLSKDLIHIPVADLPRHFSAVAAF